MAAKVENLEPLSDHPLAFLLQIRQGDDGFDEENFAKLVRESSYAPPEDYSLAIHEPSVFPVNHLDRVRLADVIGFRIETEKRALVAKKKLIRRSIDAKKLIDKALKEAMELCPPKEKELIPEESDDEEVEKKHPVTAQVIVDQNLLPHGDVPEYDSAPYEFCRTSIYKSCTSANQHLVDELQTHIGLAKSAVCPCWNMAVKAKMDKLRELCLPRRVLYRVIADVDTQYSDSPMPRMNSFKRPMEGQQWDSDCLLLEACHFEVFLPDRLDLRYISLHPELMHPDPPLQIGQIMLISVLDIAMLRNSGKECKYDGTLKYPLVWGLVKLGELLPSRREDTTRRKVYLERAAADRQGIKSDSQPLQQAQYALVDGFSFPVFFRDDRNTGGELLYADVTEREGAWLLPCEPVVNLKAYVRLTRLVRSSMPYHGLAIDFTTLEQREYKEQSCITDVHSKEQVDEFERIRAFEIICEEADTLYANGETYWESNAMLIQVNPPIIKSSYFITDTVYAYFLVSFPNWITDLKIPLFIESEETSVQGRCDLFRARACPLLSKMWTLKGVASTGIEIRVQPCDFPIQVLSALMANRTDYDHMQLWDRGLAMRGRRSFSALFGKESSLDLDIYLSKIDDAVFKKPMRLFDDTVNNNSGEEKSLGDKLVDQQAVRIAILAKEPVIILGEKGSGKTSAAIAIALGKPKLKLILAKSRADCRELAQVLDEMDPKFKPLSTPQDDFAVIEKEHECCEFFLWARIDIIITTPLTLLMRQYHRSLNPLPPLDAHAIIVDNAHDITEDMMYLCLKQCPHDQLILIGNHQELVPRTPFNKMSILRKAIEKENIYTTRIARPMKESSTREFFYPISKYSASESLARYCMDKEFPAFCDVLQLFKDAKVPYQRDAITVATCKAHADCLHRAVEDTNELVFSVSYPDEFEGVVCSIVILFGGRRAEQLWSDKKFRRYIDNSHLDVLIAIGTSNPFGFPHLTDAKQLAFKKTYFNLSQE